MVYRSMYLVKGRLVLYGRQYFCVIVTLFMAVNRRNAAGDSVLNAVKDLAAILRLHTFATRTATVIRARQGTPQSTDTPRRAQSVQPLFSSPDACSIADHATIQHQASDPQPEDSIFGLGAETTPATPSGAQQAGSTPAGTAGAAKPGSDAQLQLGLDAALPEDAGVSHDTSQEVTPQWQAPNGLAISIHDISFTSVILAAQTGASVSLDMVGQASLHLPEPDAGSQVLVPTGNGLAPQHAAAHQELSQGLGLRTSMDSLASMAFGPDGLQTLSSWGWAGDASTSSSPKLHDLEVLAEVPARGQELGSTQQLQQQEQKDFDGPEFQHLKLEPQHTENDPLPPQQVSMPLQQNSLHDGAETLSLPCASLAILIHKAQHSLHHLHLSCQIL